MADITLNAEGPSPESLTGKSNGDTVTIQNNVGADVTLTWDDGLFVPNKGKAPSPSIAAASTEEYRLGAATPAAGKTYQYGWGQKKGMKSGTIVIS